MKREELLRGLREGWGKYKYIFLLLLAGAVLLLLPSGETERESMTLSATEEARDEFSREELEERLEQALSQIEGAGRVTVVLTLEESARQVLAQEGKVGESSHETETVLVNRGSGYQETVRLQELAPDYRGALVVAQGADDPAVRLALSQAVSALTGLGADRVTICKGK